MDDAAFLKNCGVEIDPFWLAANTLTPETPKEVRNYVNSLLRIAEMFGQEIQ
jgi:hypothetical protein